CRTDAEAWQRRRRAWSISNQSQAEAETMTETKQVEKPRSAEMHPGPGFRVRRSPSRPAPELVEAFREFDTPEVSDLMNRLYTMTSAIQAVTDPALKIVGPAC